MCALDIKSRQPLPSPQERVYEWLCKEHGNSPTLPTASLMEFLRQEALALSAQGEPSPAPVQPPALVAPLLFAAAAEAGKHEPECADGRRR